MRRREFTAVGLSMMVPAGSGWAAVNESDAAVGVRAALERGALAAVGLLGRNDGFLGNPQVRIPLPEHLAGAAKFLKAVGQGKKLDELVTAMNRAAEAAVPVAKPIFVSAVKALSVEGALKLVRGSGTTVTDFFASKTRSPLGERFLPIVTQSVEKLSVAQRYNALAGKAAGLGLIKGDEANVQQYVTGRALDGLFLVIGEEEKKIRADPVKTGSAILKKVFGG